MDATWLAWNLETFPGGCSSAVSPDLLPPNQLAWGMNASFRGSKVQTRPNIACRSILPSGLIQGVGYFSVQGGMLVAMISGKPYRIRIGLNNADFSHEPIPLPWYNSGIIKQVWMVQTVESLIIQDGQSNAIIYDGSSARRSDPTTPEVPRGMQMAYGNGRLWVAVEGNQLVAGDIRTTVPGSELSFTETQYLSGGGALFFPNGITGLAFIPVVGTTDYGALLVYGANNLETVRADITQRDQWASYPGFVTNALRNIGTPSGWTLVQVNQDLFWRDSLGGIRSLNSSEAGAYFAQYQGAIADANTPLSREVSRLVDFDSQQLLGFSSGVYFDNRLLMTSSPFLNLQGGVSWRNLVSLDFAPVSTMQQKAPPAYNGSWQGVNWTQLVSGQFDGRIRAFGVSSDEDGINRLWEFDTGETDDVYLSFSDGSGVAGTQPIESFAEYPRVNFNDPKRRKRLTRCDVWLSEITGEVSLTVYYRADNQQKWTLWDEVTECATLTDNSEATPHVWKNLPPQERPQIKTFTIPDTVDDLIDYAASVGFGFQVRLVWTGSIKIERVSLWAVPLDDPDYADRTGQGPECAMNDVSGNEIVYEIPLGVQLTTADPVFSPPGGVYFTSQNVTLTSPTDGATIRYTTDGSTPTTTHGTVYASPISVSSSETIKAIAYASGLIDSGVSSAVYDLGCAGNSEWAAWAAGVVAHSGTFAANSKQIACDIITQLSGRSYSSKIKYLLPSLGANLSAALVPLRDFLHIGSPANTNFVDADFSQAHGLQGNGTNKILNLGIPPSAIGTVNNGGLGYWENNIPVAANGGVMGMAFNPGDGSRAYLIQLKTGNFSQFEWNQDLGGSSDARYNAPPVNGHYYGQRKSSALRELYLDGVNVAANTVVDPGISSDAANLRLMGADTTNIGGLTYWGGRCAVAYLTDGTLSPSEIADFHALLAAYLIIPTGR